MCLPARKEDRVNSSKKLREIFGKSVWLTLGFLVLFSAQNVWAQKGSIDVRLEPERAFVGEPVRLQVTLTLRATLQDVTVPNLDGFDVITGQWPPSIPPNIIIRGGSFQIPIVDVYLTPTRAGSLSIGSFAIKVGGTSIKSKPIAFTALERPDAPESEPSSQSTDRYKDPSFGLPESPTNTMMIHGVPDRDEVYPGGFVVVTYWLLVRPEIQVRRFEIEEPIAEGALSRVITEVQGNRLEGKEILWGGIVYAAYPISRMGFTPLSEDTLEISPLVFRMSQGFGSVLELPSQAFSIPITPLPEGAPDANGILVGNYTLSAETSVKEAHVGEAFPFSLVLSGKGDLSSYEMPPLAEIDGARIRPPAIKRDEGTEQEEQLISRLEAQYFIVPEKAGSLEVTPPSFAVLDPETATWSLLTTDPVSLEITGESAFDGKALLGLRTAREERKISSFYAPSSVSIFLGFLVPPVLFAVFLLLGIFQRKRHTRLAPFRPANTALEAAKKASTTKGFYSSISNALVLASEVRTGKALQGKTWTAVKKALLETTFAKHLTEEIILLLEKGDRARFSGEEDFGERDKDLSLAKKLLAALKETGKSA